MEIKSFLGIYNQSPPRSIPNNALVDAKDIDIDNYGVISRRNGFSIAKALANITSAYSTLDQTAYVVAGGFLYRILPDLSARQLAASTATEFCDTAKVTFSNDGLKIQDDVVTNLKFPEIDLPLKLSVIQGTMPAGTYSATYCYRASSGLEGGSAPIATIELVTDGGIAIAPVTPPAGYTVNIYLTDANGTVYYDNNGVQLDDAQVLNESFPDNAEKLAYYDSRLFVSRSLLNGSSIIWWSKPYFYHLYDMQKDYVIVPGQVLAMSSTQEALIIGTDSAIYSYADNAPQMLAGYGVVPGRPFTQTVDGNVYMHTLRGQAKCLPFVNLTEKKVSFPPGVQCSTAIVDNNGINRFVVLSDGSGQPYNARS